jgi:hypothetical protein
LFLPSFDFIFGFNQNRSYETKFSKPSVILEISNKGICCGPLLGIGNLFISLVAVKYTPPVCRRHISLICNKLSTGLRQKEKPDRNPASFKIQYPMKNRNEDGTLYFKKQIFAIEIWLLE